MATDLRALLREFHTHPNCQPEQHDLRITLHKEEHKELEAELEVRPVRDIDHRQLARELGDVVYVSYGTAHVFNINMDLVMSEIHRAAMDKLRANVRREDGKVLKPPGFRPPDMSYAVLR